MQRLLLSIAALCCSFGIAAEKSNDIDAGLAAWNAVRATIGVPPVKRDPKLEEMATRHIEYMKAVKQLTHFEDKSNPKYTPEGAKAGIGSCLGQGHNDPTGAILSQLNCFLHRIPLISPELECVSFCVDGGFSAFDYADGPRRKFEWKGPIAYPADNDNAFAPSWSGNEGPCPIPETPPKGGVGQPVTLTFAPHQKVKDGKMIVTDAGGKDIDGWLSAPDKPAVSMFSDNLQSICLIAKQPFKHKTQYTVKATATVDGQPFEKTWKFTTK